MTAHVRFATGDGVFICVHCNETYRPALPAPVRLFAAMAREFERTHKACYPRDWRLDEPTHLRNLPAGQRFVLIRTGQVFTLMGRQHDQGHTRIIVQLEGGEKQSSLSHQCIVRPFQAVAVSSNGTSSTES